MEMPFVSVVIPAYKHATLIRCAVDSVLSQTYKNIEIIVVNDGSPDETEGALIDLIRTGKIKYFFQSNQGQALARNRGLRECRGDYVAFLDDDDLWPPLRIKDHVDSLVRHVDAVGVYGPVVSFADNPPETSVPSVRALLTYEDFLEQNAITSPGAATLRGDIVRSIGGFQKITGGADDWDFWLRLTKHGPLRGVDGVGLFYRVHSANASRDAFQMLLSILQVFRRHHVGLPIAVRRNAAWMICDYVGQRVADEAFQCLRRSEIISFHRRSLAIFRLWCFSGCDPRIRRCYTHAMRSSLKNRN